ADTAQHSELVTEALSQRAGGLCHAHCRRPPARRFHGARHTSVSSRDFTPASPGRTRTTMTFKRECDGETYREAVRSSSDSYSGRWSLDGCVRASIAGVTCVSPRYL